MLPTWNHLDLILNEADSIFRSDAKQLSSSWRMNSDEKLNENSNDIKSAVPTEFTEKDRN